MKKQLKNAEKSGARVAVIVDSTSPDHVKWKEMEQREQFDVSDGGLARFARDRFHIGNEGGA